MARKNLIRSEFYPYHITGRVNNKEVFPIPMPEMWHIFGNECYSIQTLFDVEIHALVLMPNHFHLLMTVPREEFDLGRVMNRLMCDLTLQTHRISGRTGRLFGKRYHWSIIQTSRYCGHALKYVYRNPVKAGLCQKVEEYPFSTLHGLIGKSHLPFPIHFTRGGLELNIPDSNERSDWVKWLNIPFTKEAEGMVQKVLRQKEIRFLLCRETRRPVELLESLL